MNESNGHRDHKLSSVYREGAWPEPSRQIDQAILSASRRAWREQPFFKRWAPALAVAATVLLTSSLVLKVYLAQPDAVSPSGPEKPPEPGAGQAPAAEQATGPVRPQAEAPAPQPVTTPPPGFSSSMDAGEAARLDRMQRDLSTLKLSTPPSESPAPKSSLAEKSAPPAKKEAADALQRRPAAPQANAPVSVFGAAPPAQQAARAVGKPAQPFTQTAAPPRPETQGQEAQPAQTPPLTAPETRQAPNLATSQAAAVSAGSAAKGAERPPQAWIEDIRKLMKEGKSEEAGGQLADFKKRYPDYVLPEDLR